MIIFSRKSRKFGFVMIKYCRLRGKYWTKLLLWQSLRTWLNWLDWKLDWHIDLRLVYVWHSSSNITCALLSRFEQTLALVMVMEQWWQWHCQQKLKVVLTMTDILTLISFLTYICAVSESKKGESSTPAIASVATIAGLALIIIVVMVAVIIWNRLRKSKKMKL